MNVGKSGRMKSLGKFPKEYHEISVSRNIPQGVDHSKGTNGGSIEEMDNYHRKIENEKTGASDLFDRYTL